MLSFFMGETTKTYDQNIERFRKQYFDLNVRHLYYDEVFESDKYLIMQIG